MSDYDLDLKLTVGVDREALVKSFISGLKEAQREAEKETVTYTLKPDKTNFLSEIKTLLSSTPDLNKEIKLVLDDSSFKKGLTDVEKYANKSAKFITSSYKKEFQNVFSKEDSLYLDKILGLGEGENKSKSKVKNKIKEITNELKQYTTYSEDKKTGSTKINGIDLSKVSDYKDLERVVNLTKELDAILKQTGEKGHYKVDLVDRKGLEDSVKSLQSGYSQAMIEYGNSYKTQLQSMKSDTADIFSELQKLLLNVFMGVADKASEEGKKAAEDFKDSVKNGIEGTGEALSDEVQQGVEKSKKHIQELENNLSNTKKKIEELSKGDGDSYKKIYENLDKAKAAINNALDKGDEISKEDAQTYIDLMKQLTAKTYDVSNETYQKEAKYFGLIKQSLQESLGEDFVPLNKMQNRKQLYEQYVSEQRQYEQELQKEKQTLDELNQKQQEVNNTANERKVIAEETATETTAENKEGRITVNEEEVRESLNRIREELKQLQDTETKIDIKVNLADDTATNIQSQISTIEPKPTIEVEAKIKIPENAIDGIEVSKVKDVINTIDESALNESTEYVNALKKQAQEIATLNGEIAVGKAHPSEENMQYAKIFNQLIDEIVQKYPELSKIQNVLSNSAVGESFIGSDQWKDFLATLPQARAYLESIGYDFNKIDQIKIVSENEIKTLEGLRDILSTIKRLVDEKTEAFGLEEQKVNSVVSSEITKLSELEGKISTIAEEISDSITTLLQENLKKQDINEEVEEVIEEVDEGTHRLTQSEKQFNNIVNKIIKEFLNGAKVSSQTIHNLREELKEMFASGDLNSSRLTDILQDDAGYVTSRFGSNYSEIKRYLRDVKVKYSNTDKAEFKDEWDDVVNAFGWNLRKGEGVDPMTLLNELAAKYDISNNDVNNTQDAIRRIYEYLTETPKKYAEMFQQFRKSTEYADEYFFDKKLAEYAKNVKVPTSYMGEVKADSQEELDKINAKQALALQTEYEETEQLIEAQQRLQAERESASAISPVSTEKYKEETQAVEEDANTQQKLNEVKKENLSQVIAPTQELDSEKTKIEDTVNAEKEKLKELAATIQTEIPNAIATKNEAFDTEKVKVNETVDAEKEKFQELAKYIETDIPKAISNKNAAFDTEKAKIDEVVEAEKEKLKELSDIIQTGILNTVSNGKVSTKTDTSVDNTVNQSTSESAKFTAEEAQAMADLFDKALKAAQAKREFAEANKSVLESVISSLLALNSEGNGFNNLNKIISNLANNENDRITILVKNLNSIRDALVSPVNDSAFVNSLKELAQQRDSLKDLAIVLKASKEQIEQAQDPVKAKASSEFSKNKKSIQSDVSKLSKQINKLGNKDVAKGLADELKKVSDELSNVGKNSEKLQSVSKALTELTNKVETAETAEKNTAADAKTLIGNYRELTSLYKQLKSTPEGSQEAQAIQNRIDKLEKENKVLETNNYTEQQSENITRAKTKAEVAEQAAIEAKEKASRQAAEAEEKAAKAAEDAEKRLNNLRTTLLSQASALKSNGKLMRVYGDEIDQMIADLSNTGTTEDALYRIQIRLKEIRAEANQTGNTGKTLMQVLSTRFKSLFSYLSTFASFYRIVSYIRTAFTTIKDLDTQLVDLRKTTSMTTTELNQFYKASSDVGKELGVTTSEIISQAAAWSRFNKIDPLYGNI